MTGAKVPSLSVVVPTWNEEGTLPRLLGRLAASGADGADEVVVSDGGSADRTRDVARRAGARVVVAGRGRGRQLAAGARATGGELLVFLHADSLPEPGALRAVREAFAADPGLLAAGLRQRIEHPARFYRWVETAADLRTRRLGVVYGDSGLCVRREAYLRAGGFSDQPLFEDVDLSRRLRRLGRVGLVHGAVLRVSPRRWMHEGRVRATARNWLLTAGYWCGVDPEHLARLYRPHAVDGGRRSA